MYGLIAYINVNVYRPRLMAAGPLWDRALSTEGTDSW